MIKLKSLILEGVETLSPKDIYNFYYLFSLMSYQPEVFKTEYGEFIRGEYLKSFKAKYLQVFKKLMYDQIVKYAQRGRIDPDFPKDKLAAGASLSTKELLELMKKTFRSDMTRRNDVWIEAGEMLDKLQSAVQPNDIVLWVDQLNSAIHNTKTLILGKESPVLLSALLKAQSAKSIGELERHADKDLRSLTSQDQFEGVDTEFFRKPKIGSQPTPSKPGVKFPPLRPSDDEEEARKNRERELKYGALQEAFDEAGISPEDRENEKFMRGVRTAIKDKSQEISRNLKAHSPDFVRGYQAVLKPGIWDKFNTQMTDWLGRLGYSRIRS